MNSTSASFAPAVDTIIVYRLAFTKHGKLFVFRQSSEQSNQSLEFSSGTKMSVGKKPEAEDAEYCCLR